MNQNADKTSTPIGTKTRIKRWKFIVPIVIAVVLVVSLVGVYLFLNRGAEVTSKTLTVDDNGPADYSTIRAAVNAANPGDTVQVAAGTYNESYTEIKKALTLLGADKSTTVIDGQGTTGAVIAIKANNVNISGFTIRNAAWGTAGVYVGQASGCSVKNNEITSNTGGYGISLYHSDNNDVSDNLITSNERGIDLSYSSNNTIHNNTIASNVDGIYLSYESMYNVFSNNTITNNDYHGFHCYSYYGELPCNYTTLTGNVISNNSRGVTLEYSSNNTFTENVVSNNSEFGINLRSSNSALISNQFSNNGEYSIAISNANDSSISKNTISDSYWGIELNESSNNKITKNTIHNNTYAIHMLIDCNDSLICENTIYNNSEGIQIALSYDNTLYHNNFIDNTIQAYCGESTNTWDNGSTTGGNYWSDHACTGNPSDGSNPYTIDAYNVDRYPFQDPNGWSP